MNQDVEKILQEIFDPFIQSQEIKTHTLRKSPSFKEIEKFAELILKDESEESFQKYLSKNSSFLFRQALATDESPLGILAKPPIGNFNFADYAIFSVSQGGCHVWLIEIERPSDKLFTKKLTPANKLQTALGQIHDWNESLKSNRSTFFNSAFKLLKEAPKYPKSKENGSFIYCAKNKIDEIWNGFGGNDYCTFHYVITLGRWSQLTQREKQRLAYYNQMYHNENITIRTYDNFIRKAIDGPKYLW